jgi:hypothetical protein
MTVTVEPALPERPGQRARIGVSRLITRHLFLQRRRTIWLPQSHAPAQAISGMMGPSTGSFLHQPPANHSLSRLCRRSTRVRSRVSRPAAR